MSIADAVRRTVAAGDRTVRQSPERERLKRFLEEMKRRGAVTKQTYDLPSVDTIGRSRYSRGQKPA